MTKDLNKGISAISYNLLNLPQQVDILSPAGEARNTYSYSADGEKLRVVKKYNSNFNTSPIIGSAVNVSSMDVTKTTDYVDGKIFENNTLDRIQVDGGYIKGGVYYFYETDHLGDNRTVINQLGTVVERNDYYPYGMQMAHNQLTNSASGSDNKRKFGNKELDVMHGLNLYDFSARSHDPTLGRFTTVDPLAEKYYSISPYVYCNNNPLRFTDPDGREVDIEHKTGFLGLGKKETLKYDNGNLYNKDGSAYTGKVNGFLKKTVNALGSLNQTKEGASIVTELQSSSNVFTIKSGATNQFKPDSPSKAGANLTEVQAATGNTAGSTGSGGTIFWNSSSTSGGLDLSGGTTRPAYISLGHEMGHGSDANQGLLHYGTMDENGNINPPSYENKVTGVSYNYGYNGLLKSEWRAVYRENLIRGQAGVPLRAYYGYDITTGSPLPTGPRLLDATNQPLNYP